MKRRLFAITVLVVALLFCSWRTVGAASTSEEGMSVSKTFAHGQAFVHPGLLHNRADLAFIKQKVAGGILPRLAVGRYGRQDPCEKSYGDYQGVVLHAQIHPGPRPEAARRIHGP